MMVSAISCENNLRSPGQYFDVETRLHYNYHRYYDPGIGRYLRTDPIGFGGSDVNLYAFVRNNPINFWDPYGPQGMLDPRRLLFEKLEDEINCGCL